MDSCLGFDQRIRCFDTSVSAVLILACLLIRYSDKHFTI